MLTFSSFPSLSFSCLSFLCAIESGSEDQDCHILVSNKVSAQTASPMTSRRAGVWVVVGRVCEWDVLGKTICVETESRSAAEPYIEESSD